jgi:hypothetical protein
MSVRMPSGCLHPLCPPENYSQAQLNELDSLTERWVADHLRNANASKTQKRTRHSRVRKHARIKKDVRVELKKGWSDKKIAVERLSS